VISEGPALPARPGSDVLALYFGGSNLMYNTR
jgi:hypothetical protein